MSKTKQVINHNVVRQSLRLGFVPLSDAAPLIMARELGLYKKYGLRVTLHRELGWATIRDKIVYGELEAAHALVAMPIAATLGLGSIRCDSLTALILNLNGNAITLSEQLWKAGVRNPSALGIHIRQLGGDKRLTFGIVHRFSSHRYLLSKWLLRNGIDPENDVRMVVLPPSQMVANLTSGNLDGFCVGEPWNSVAVTSGQGWCIETSEGIDPEHPEKALMVRTDFAEKCDLEHCSLVAAVLEACIFCDGPENAEQIAQTLSRPEYLNTSIETLYRPGQSFDFGHGITKKAPNFCVFHRHNANKPDVGKSAWAVDVVKAALTPDEKLSVGPGIGEEVFRPDIFAQAHQFLSKKNMKHQFTNEDKTELKAA
jgi:ABC-type nitrate/sulfonate/bicarbonate transport system substrate-binding protein